MAARLTREEVLELIEVVMHGVKALEDDGELPRASWGREVRECMDMLMERLLEGDDDADADDGGDQP